MTRRVLVVDDDPLLREVAQAALELVGGWEVCTAQSGPQAQQRALAEHPDAILLDVMMPGLDGPTTFEHLQADPLTRDIPVLLLTAKVQTADRARFEALGVQGVLSKPFDPMKLPSEVAEALGWAA
jgi:CheY-like chemotaxis protein